jgi:hypothetical protein
MHPVSFFWRIYDARFPPKTGVSKFSLKGLANNKVAVDKVNY